MSQRQIKVVQPTDQVRSMSGVGDDYRFLATGADTDGAYFLVEATVSPGGGPPPHIQTREEEAFYILEGEVTFYGEEGEIIARPGTYLNIPKGVIHNFRNNTDQVAKMLFFFVPAGLEKFFDAIGAMEEPASEVEMLTALNALGEKYGVRFGEE